MENTKTPKKQETESTPGALLCWVVSRQLQYTGWLKLKYPTGQNAISRQPCEIFIPKFLSLYGSDPATILKFKKNYFSFLQRYGCINIICRIFNYAWNNQQQLVIFIVMKHWLTANTKISQVVHFSVCLKCPPPAFTQAQSLFGKLNMALLIESCGSWSHINCRTFLSSSMFSGWVEMTYSVQA